MKSHRRFSEVSVVLCLVTLTSQVFANPVGESLRAGRARFDRSAPGSLSIYQNSDKLIVNWREFSIAAGETTRFIQPSATSIALNRVVTANPSRLFGNLEANGKVYLINPNGILVGRGGAVNTRGFVASTLDVSDASFLSSAKLKLSGDSEASVVNEGSIQAIGGDVFLVGRTVENSGNIRAGTVGLGAGSEVVIVPTGRERLSVIAGNANGGQADKGVNNQGTIEAVSAELKAAGGNIYALAINNGGIIRATGVRREGGRVFLSTDGGNIENSGSIIANNSDGSGGSVSLAGGHNEAIPATVINSGVIEARGDAAGTKGGEVRMTGDYVGLFGSSVIDVSGHSGGGTALVGGDYHGGNPAVQNAQRAFVATDASIKADARVLGNGGKVVVWSDEITRFNGSISARGGSDGGNGGFAEVSGKTFLSFNGRADLTAPRGLVGTILLDPQDLTIQATGANDGIVTATGVAFADPDTTTDVTISASVIEALTGSIMLEAHRNLTIDAALTLNNQTSGETVQFVAGGDLTINASVVTAGASLSFTASDAVGADSATATLTVGANVGDANTGAISFINDGSGGITISAAVRTGNDTIADANNAQNAISRNITINSGGPVNLMASGSLTTGSAQVTGADSGADTATSGNISITAGAGATVTLAGTVTTGNATVGNGDGTDDANSGNITVNAGGAILVSGTLTTGNAEALEVADNGDQSDTATSGSISLTAGSAGAITVNNNLTTGTAKLRDSAGDADVATTGGITLQSGLGIGGSGRLITGAATLRGDAATGADAATSGSIQLTAGTGGVSGGVGLSAADALTTGNAIRINAASANLNADIRRTGDITLNSRDEINNGTASTPLSVLIGVPTLSTADQGAVNVMPTVAGGNIFLTSSDILRIGDIVAGAGNVTLEADEIDLVGGNDSVQGSGALVLRPATDSQDIELSGTGGTRALDGVLDLTATELAAIKAGFSGITIGRDIDGTGTLTVAGATTFSDDVTLVAGSLALDATLTSSLKNVILTARTGNITDGNLTADNVVATSLAASAQTGINLDTDITTLASATTVSGNISVEDTAGDLAVGTVSAPGGSVTLVSAGAITDGNGALVNVTADNLSVTANAGGIDLDTDITTLTLATAIGAGANIDINDLAGNLAVGVVTATGDTVTLGSAGAITDANGGAANVIAGTLSATAQSGIALDTDITTLTLASVLAAGTINISDVDGLAVTDAHTFDGNIILAAAGDLTATLVTAGTGATSSGNGNVQLTTTGGTGNDVVVGAVTADGDSVNINASGSITDNNGALVNVTADSLTATSAGAAGIDLDTIITTLASATANGSGDIHIQDLADDLSVGTVTASGNTVTLISAGAITDGNANGTVNVTADSLSATAQSGIDLDTDITTLTLASVLGAGAIDISDADNLAVTDAHTFAGNITLAAAGDLTANLVTAGTGVPAGSGNGNVQLTTTGGTGNNVVVGTVSAVGDSVTINSAGAITDNNGALANVVADSLSATAQSGIDLDTTIATLSLASLLAAGNINIADTDGLVVTSATAANGNIDITAGGALNVASATTTSGGNITLHATGGNLDVTSVNAGGNGDVQLTTTTSGDVNVDSVTAAGDTVTITSAGGITDANGATVNVVAGDLSATAQTGIDLDTTLTTLTLAQVNGAGNISIADTDGLILTAATAANGMIDISAGTASDLTVGAVTASGNINLTAGRSVLDDGTTAANVTSSGGITTVTATAGNIGTSAKPLDIEAPGGAVNLTASTGGVHVNNVGGGDVQFQAPGVGAQAAFTQGGQTYTLKYLNDLTVETGGNITAGAGVTVSANVLTLRAGGDIGASSASPLLTAVGTLAGSADNIWVSDSGSLVLGDLSATAGELRVQAQTDLTVGAASQVSSSGGGLRLAAGNNITLSGDLTADGAATEHLLVIADNTVNLTGSPTLEANAASIVLVGKSPVAFGLNITAGSAPMLNSRFVIYAQSARLTFPKFLEDESRISPLPPGTVLRGISFGLGDEENPIPGGIGTDNGYIFVSNDKGITDPSLFIDIPVEVFQPVSIVFGDYDPTKFGEVGDLWMSSSELYEIERKARKARKELPPQVNRAKYTPQAN